MSTRVLKLLGRANNTPPGAISIKYSTEVGYFSHAPTLANYTFDTPRKKNRITDSRNKITSEQLTITCLLLPSNFKDSN